MTPLAGERAPLVEPKIRFPAEFEPQDAVWLAWPRYSNTRELPLEPVMLDIVEALAGVVGVDILVQDRTEVSQIRRSFGSRRVDETHLRFHELPHADIWLRDTGPEFVHTGDGLARPD